MILTIFRPRRVKNGKPCVARSYRGRYRLEGEENISDIPLYTTDKRVARERLEQIVREKQLESVGLLPKQSIRAASRTALERHLCEYVADLEATGRSGKYIHDLKKRVLRLMRECGWTQVQNVTSNSFLSWRVKQKLAPKTVNEYLTSLRSLLNWMKMHERIERDPMHNVQKVQSNGNQVYARRAFTRPEIQRLLAVAGPRKAIYLTAVFTGLRRGELAALEWGDVHLNNPNPFLNVRASTTKNHRQAVIPLHRDVVTELRELQAQCSSVSSRVFKSIPRMNIFKADLRAARIDPVDGRGQRTDFHALRHTLATNLALAGTAPRVAMEVMRHSDMRLTSKTYTDAGLLPLADAVTKLPSFADSDTVDSQRDSQSLFRRSHSLSLSVTNLTGEVKPQETEKEEIAHILSAPVMPGQDSNETCAMQGSNLRLPACEAGALPLS